MLDNLTIIISSLFQIEINTESRRKIYGPCDNFMEIFPVCIKFRKLQRCLLLLTGLGKFKYPFWRSTGCIYFRCVSFVGKADLITQDYQDVFLTAECVHRVILLNVFIHNFLCVFWRNWCDWKSCYLHCKSIYTFSSFLVAV